MKKSKKINENISKIINLDFLNDKEKSEKVIQRELREIKPLAKFPLDKRVPLEMIEKYIFLMVRKYNAHIVFNYITFDDYTESYPMFHLDLMFESECAIITIHGLSLYEVLSKTAVALFKAVSDNVIKVR